MSSLLLKTEELKRLDAKARLGDREAIGKLTTYYTIVHHDEKTVGQYWKILADKGNPEGVGEYGWSLMRQGDLVNARRWLLKAKAMNYPNAAAYLEDLEKLEDKVRHRND